MNGCGRAARRADHDGTGFAGRGREPTDGLALRRRPDRRRHARPGADAPRQPRRRLRPGTGVGALRADVSPTAAVPVARYLDAIITEPVRVDAGATRACRTNPGR